MVTYRTMMKRITSAITQFTCALSAPALKPVSFRTAAICLTSAPSTLADPMVVTMDLPATDGADLNESPCLVRKSFTLSQSLNLLHGPTNTWKLQSVASTVMGFFCV